MRAEVVMRAAGCWLAACALLLGGAHAVSVMRLPVLFEQDNTITVDNTIEYILEFNPTAEQAQWPARIRLAASAGDTARPVLLTARQTTGAQTWQLPYQGQEGDQPLYELHRTLCFTVSESSGPRSEHFTLHISSANNASVQVSARVDPARDWRLAFDAPSTAHITLMSSRVYYYRFAQEQENVRLVLESEDDVCATIAVQNYTCPVAETAEAVTRAGGFYMTMQRSAGMHIARSQFPNGFYVVATVQGSDEQCTREEPAESDWLYEAATGQDRAAPAGQDHAAPAAHTQHRAKTITLELKAALTRGQYAVACIVTVVVFIGFYAAFLGIVFAQRFDPVQRAVGPKAVLAEANCINNATEEGVSSRDERRRRYDSDATFDSTDDDSESDEEPQSNVLTRAAATNIAYSEDNMSLEVNSVPTNGTAHTNTPGSAYPAATMPNIPSVTEVVDNERNSQQQRSNGDNIQREGAGGAAPFGLPARLNVAAMARRREHTLRARSDRYLSTLYTVAVFYALPVLQFVAAFQIVLNVSGSLDLCYYNFLCAHPVGLLSDFNHVFSNLGYLLLGALFLLQEYGIPAHYGLLSSLGAGMMVVALLSASYHVCPNQLNFQFDTAFMYVLAVLSMVKMYQARHPDINARAHSTFGVLAVLIALVVWGVLGGGALFWGVFTVLHVFTFLLLSLRIYYVGQFTLDQSGLAEAARGLRAWRGSRPLYASRLAALWLANAVNWAFAFYGLFTMSADFASHLLFIMLSNTLLYMVFYLSMKLAHGERLRWYAWVYLAGAAAAWAPAMLFFVSGSSSWAASPAQSRQLNHECRVLQFYDAHDLWHMLSAVALYLSFNVMLTWDDGLSAVKRTEIAVF